MPIIRLGRITETPVPRAATTSTKSAPRVLRPKRRCAGAFRIIKAATRRGTHEPAGPGCLGDATGAGCCAGRASRDAVRRSAKVLGRANEHGISANTRFEICIAKDYPETGFDLAAFFDGLFTTGGTGGPREARPRM